MARHVNRTPKLRVFINKNDEFVLSPEHFMFMDCAELRDGFNDFGDIIMHRHNFPDMQVEVVLGYCFVAESKSLDDDDEADPEGEVRITRVAVRTTIGGTKASWKILASCYTRVGYHHVSPVASYYDYEHAVSTYDKVAEMPEETRVSLTVLGGMFNFYSKLGLDISKPIEYGLVHTIHEDMFSHEELITAFRDYHEDPKVYLESGPEPSEDPDDHTEDVWADVIGDDLTPLGETKPNEIGPHAPDNTGAVPMLNQHGLRQLDLMLSSLYHSGRMSNSSVGVVNVPPNLVYGKTMQRIVFSVLDEGTEETRLGEFRKFATTQIMGSAQRDRTCQGYKTRLEFVTDDKSLIVLMKRRGYLPLEPGGRTGALISRNLHRMEIEAELYSNR